MTTKTTEATVLRLKEMVRDVPDFPQPGILFRDITPLLADAESFRLAVDALSEPFGGITKVVSIESRGFILGSPIAYNLHAGLVPVRKVGRLPWNTLQVDYALEYGVNTLEIHRDAIAPGERVLIVDDLLATGGTVRAAIDLIEQLGGIVEGISVLAELSGLNGRQVLPGYLIHSLIVYE